MDRHVLVALLALLAASDPARAQDINLKCGSTTPSAAFGAASGQAGHWNQVLMSQSTAMLDLAGQPTSAVATGSSSCDNGSCGECPFGGTCGSFPFGPDESAFFLTWLNGDCLGFNTVTLTGLEPGSYRLHSYAYHPCDPTKTSNLVVRVLGAGQAVLYERFFPLGGVPYTGTWSGFPVGLDVFAVAPGESLVVRFSTGTTWGGLIGLQLDHLEPTGVAACFGDGSGAPCPCANSGLPGHGCRNSASVRGAELAAAGAASLAADTLALACDFLVPGVSAVALQGDQSIAPTAFGDGLRCAGGNLKRLYLATASPGGSLLVPAVGSPSISARSAALGDAIAAGTSRWYQVYYRDPSTTFCPEPQGSTFNVSNAVEVTWQL